MSAFCRRFTARLFFLISLIASGLAPAIGSAQSTQPRLDGPLVKVAFTSDDTLRDVVGTHLNDPDLWPIVLQLSGLDSPAQVVPGVLLSLPVEQVKVADAALDSSLFAIQRATAEGARLFAPTEIGEAIASRDAAVTQRTGGQWREVVILSGRAEDFANEAHAIALEQRDRAAEALISDIHGRVQGRNPAESRWSSRDLNDVLVEFERLRTLSNSTTQVTFRDLSRLRLNPNSNATIQRMRSDPLTGGDVTKVSLTNGDFYALLNQLSERDEFEIDLPGIDTRTASGDFWVKNEQGAARFVNFDEAELDIQRGAETISLGENEGVVLTGQGAKRAQVLLPPILTSPPGDAVVHGNSAQLEWQEQDGAVAYWYEVARDPAFNRMHLTQWGAKGLTAPITGLTPGPYHWRVAALDQLGLPGEWSEPRRFTVRIDETPPFLAVLAPGDGTTVDAARIELLGASEPDARVTLNGAPVTLAGDGSFLTATALAPGANTLRIVATDPAGNQSDKVLGIHYRAPQAVPVTLDARLLRDGDTLVTRTDDLTLQGRAGAVEGAALVLRDAVTGAELGRARTGAEGRFTIALPVAEDTRQGRIEVLAPSGAVEGTLDFTARRDSVPPQLRLDLPAPLAMAIPELVLTGNAGDATRLLLGDREIALGADGRFDVALTLEPGPNVFDLRAADAAGNVTTLRAQTVLDPDPPEILGATATRPQGADGPIEIVIEARDATGLRPAAPYILAIGGTERDGFLRCDTATGICRDRLPAEPGKLRLIEIIVEDYAGNEAFR